MVEGGGLLIPAHGLGLAVVQVMLVLPELRPRASITAPKDGMIPFNGVSMKFSTPQKLRLGGGGLVTNTLASMKAEDF
jgi:hypothetical protein